MATWNSVYLESTYHVLGWMAFFSWTIGFYPQILLNFQRKSVVGLNFDFVVLNLTKHSSYLIYNAALFFSPEIQRQYHEKYGYGEMIPVAANDVALSIHCVLVTCFVSFQVLIYEVLFYHYLKVKRGNQKVSKICIIVSSAAWAIVLVCLFISWPKHSWLWLISVCNTIQVAVTAVKYIPQAFMNFSRKSTVGWSIGFVLLDLSGGLLNFAQMATQSIDQGTMINFYGNMGKTLLSLVVVFFDILFIIQHYVLYPKAKKETNQVLFEEAVTTLINSPDKSQENA